MRVTKTFSLSLVVEARIRHMARQRAVSCSRIIEDLIGGVDFVEMFQLFKDNATFADVVIQTGQPPMLVREVFADYKAGLDGQGDKARGLQALDEDGQSGAGDAEGAPRPH